MRRMFSENQIEKLAIEKVQQEIENGDLSLEQEIDVTEEEWKSYSSGEVEIPELEVENIYTKIRLIGGVLHIVANIKITNNSGGTLTYPTIRKNVILPADVADKIYDLTGKKASESNSACITAATFVRGLTSSFDNTANWGFIIMNMSATNKIQLKFKDINSIANEQSIWMTARVALIL